MAVPTDIKEAGARLDADWPLQPDLADKPFAAYFWGRDAELFAAQLRAAGHPVINNTAFFGTFEALTQTRSRLSGGIVGLVTRGPDPRAETNGDGRELCTVVAEMMLPDGRRHLLVSKSMYATAKNTEFIWREGNWSCDCNRSLDLHRDGVRDLGFPLGEDGEPDAPCTPAGSARPSLRLGWLVLRFRHLVTGAERFEVVHRLADDVSLWQSEFHEFTISIS